MADLNINNFGEIIGKPVNPYQQAYSDTCAIKSQQLILNEFGVEVTEDQLVEYSAEHGWYNGNGTSMSDVGKILADAGIPCTQSIDANIYDLADELSRGHKVIVAVDSGELWDNGILDWLKDIFMGDTPDHALIVAGIDMTDPNNPMVVLTDPGTGQPAEPYPLDQFIDAWGDSQNFMVSTDIPTPTAVDSFTENGMTDMHLSEIAGVDYSTFQDFRSYSHLIDPSQLNDLNMAFQCYPTMTTPDFNMALNTYGLPYFDMSLYQPMPMSFDPMMFDYTGLCDTSWMTAPVDTYSAEQAMIEAQTYEKLSDLRQDALDYAQQCLDNGDYFNAQMWQNEAHNIQMDMNDYI